MKPALPLLLLALTLASCTQQPDPRIADLEKRVTALEANEHNTARAESDRLNNLRNCLTEAKTRADSFVHINAPASQRNSATVTVPQFVVEEARRRESQDIETCKLLYGAQQ